MERVKLLLVWAGLAAQSKLSLSDRLRGAMLRLILVSTTLLFHGAVAQSQENGAKQPRWEFRKGGVFVLADRQRSLVLGGTFARDNLDRFLEGSDAQVAYTEGEDCTKCYYVDLGKDGSLFVDSPDGLMIDQIKGYGPLFKDEHDVRGWQNVKKGAVLFCDDGYEEVCLPDPKSTVGYIIDRGQCDTPPPPSGSDLAKRKFTGCEIIAGLEIY